MVSMIRIHGVRKLANELNSRLPEAGLASAAEVRVGYTAEYAVYVHEAPMTLRGKKRPKPTKGRYWDPQGRATNKFLERPFRAMKNSGELIRIISTAYKNGASLEQSLSVAGLRIQRLSQLMVPVDIGHLKGSAFTRKGKK
tara:strand:+ start:222 stop:644 length:423 start_codon:yes stop_codon:yes gene_type:complete